MYGRKSNNSSATSIELAESQRGLKTVVEGEYQSKI